MSTMKERIASLRSTSGATILMALLALLVVAMVSTVILAAAVSTVKQEKSDVEFQQCQLDLQSAGQYALMDIVGALEGNSDEQGGTTVAVTAKKTIEHGVEVWTESEPVASGNGVYSQALADAVKAVHYGSTPLVSDTYVAQLPDITLKKTSGSVAGADSDGFEQRTVKVKLTALPGANDPGSSAADGYMYIFEFSSANSAREGASRDTSQVLCLRLEERCSNTTSADGNEKTTTYSWSFDRFEALGGDGSAN